LVDNGFSARAKEYEKDSLVQKNASEELLSLLSIKGSEDVLDLGCGPGHVTRKIARITRGRVVGADISEGMIREASSAENNPPNAVYQVKNAADLRFEEEFDVIFCNSTFQWFLSPQRVLKHCYSALRKGGRMGVQSPATSMYCPNFVAAIEKVKRDPDTRHVFKTFKSPWLFPESTDEYRKLFEECGFTVAHCSLQKETGNYRAGQVYRIFRSGAENGYLNSNFYSITPDEAYIEEFRRLVWDSIMEQSDDNGVVLLEFTRIYLVAEK